jgi:Na+/proline symporter
MKQVGGSSTSASVSGATGGSVLGGGASTLSPSAQTSENFNTASRSVGTGLIAAVVVSQWTCECAGWELLIVPEGYWYWLTLSSSNVCVAGAATIWQSASVSYQYGVSGPYAYASGACIQVLIFSLMSVQVKLNAPNAHTYLEIMRVRYGHKGNLFFSLTSNILVISMLLLGGSVVVSALTGMSVQVAIIFMPIGVLLYTVHGGLKSSFIACYLHTIIVSGKRWKRQG